MSWARSWPSTKRFTPVPPDIPLAKYQQLAFSHSLDPKPPLIAPFERRRCSATDLCATEPERAARMLVDGGFTPRYDYALQTLKDNP
jgi:hypothetical protein